MPKVKIVKKSRAQKQEPANNSNDVQSLAKSVEVMRSLLASQLVQTATHHVQQGNASQGDISQLAAAITKLAEATAKITGQNTGTGNVGIQAAEVKEGPNGTKLSRMEKIKMQKFLSNYMYDTEFSDTTLERAFPKLDLYYARQYALRYLTGARSRKASDVYETITNLHPKFAYQRLPSGSERLNKVRMMLGYNLNATKEDVAALLEQECLDDSDSAPSRAYIRVIIQCIVSSVGMTKRKQLYEQFLKQEKAKELIEEGIDSSDESPSNPGEELCVSYVTDVAEEASQATATVASKSLVIERFAKEE